MVQTIFADFAAMWPAALPQRHQRRHAAALADAGQPRAGRAARPPHRRRLARRPRRGLKALARQGRGQARSAQEFLADQARQQGAPGRTRAARLRRHDLARQPVRRADQAHPRIQAPAAQRAARRRALPGHRRQPGRRLGAAHRDLRRQGGLGVPRGQADHPADPRRRARRQRRPARGQQAQGGVPAELRRQPGRGHHARRPT